jgi:hypothetical protein
LVITFLHQAGQSITRRWPSKSLTWQNTWKQAETVIT